MPRRRFQFGIGTLLVVVTLAAVIAAVLAYQYAWLRQRTAFSAADSIRVLRSDEWKPGPGLLWTFRESRLDVIFVPEPDTERAAELFPEAAVLNAILADGEQ